jgi:hypothetical protein
MAQTDEKQEASALDAPSPADEAGSALPPPVREHLARQLRAAYHEMAEKPAFLGDPAIPPVLEDHVRRLETRERTIHDRAVEAVEKALGEVLEEKEDRFPGEPDGRKPDRA